MMRQTEARPVWQLGEFDRTLMVASHYGFLPMQGPSVIPQDIDITSDCEEHPHYKASEKAAFIRTYMEHGLSEDSHPLALAYKIPNRNRNSKSYALELVGYPSGVAEAMLLRAGLSILLDRGHKEMVVDINCIGDKESVINYEKELQSYVRRTGDNLSPELKKELKKDAFNLIHSSSPELEEMRKSAPNSLSFLSAQSRTYFKEVLEYVEALDVEFRLAPHLVGNKNYCSHTIFAIRDSVEEGGEPLAVGYSYSRLARRFGFKKDMPLSGITIFPEAPSEKQKKSPTGGRVYKKIPRSKFYLVQLGKEAKMRSLPVIELLRREKIPIYHFLGKDKIASQFAAAESLGVPYILIMGQREALENSVIVRNVSTRAQETVLVRDLPGFLKKIPL